LGVPEGVYFLGETELRQRHVQRNEVRRRKKVARRLLPLVAGDDEQRDNKS
jgi:hypothetical protein